MASKIPEERQDEKVKQKNSYEFENFPSQESIRSFNSRPFRENVRSFLPEFGDQIHADSGMSLRSTTLVTGEENHRLSFPLYTIEETFGRLSLKPCCGVCEFIGWDHHFACKRTYYFIIPPSNHWIGPWKDEIRELETCILYGMVHSNGDGHLIFINGLKEEPKYLSKTRLMNFWDRLCSTLCTRKMSVQDETDVRLFYGVVHGQSWFGRWGYEFSRGSFGVTEEKYKAAIEYLKSLKLDEIVNDSKKKRHGLKISTIVQNCRGATDVELKTLSDMLRFMMGIGKPINADALAKLLAKKNKAENTKKTEDKIRLMLNQMMILLNESQGSGGGKACIGRQKMLDEIKKCDGVGSKSLINSVLESITRFVIGNCVIRRLRISTKDFEFTIEEEVVDEGAVSATNSDCNKLPEEMQLQDKSMASSSSSSKTPTSKRDKEVAVEDHFGKNDGIIDSEETNVFYVDILSLCKVLVALYKDSVEAVRNLLDSKNFVKEWEQNSNQLISSELERWQGIDYVEKLGHDEVTVDCSCGAKYWDGERIIQCSECGVYHHRRCRGFVDADGAKPEYFLCAICTDTDN